MQKSLTEKFVEKAILKHLTKKGWDYNVKTKGLHERGCDIVVTDSRSRWTTKEECENIRQRILRIIRKTLRNYKKESCPKQF